jgi:hypothetical protein
MTPGRAAHGCSCFVDKEARDIGVKKGARDIGIDYRDQDRERQNRQSTGHNPRQDAGPSACHKRRKFLRVRLTLEIGQKQWNGII